MSRLLGTVLPVGFGRWRCVEVVGGVEIGGWFKVARWLDVVTVPGQLSVPTHLHNFTRAP